MTTKNLFLEEANKVAFDAKFKKILRHNLSMYFSAYEKGVNRFQFLEKAKQKVSYYKRLSINDLSGYLIQFEENISKRNVTVLWAYTVDDALKHIDEISLSHHAKMVVKSKSMISEELELNHHFDQQNIASLETDLGEFIVQVAGEKPFHLLTPAMHKSKENVADLFTKSFGIKPNSTPTEVTNFARNYLRQKYVDADIGISGANFLIADVGGVALTENEGNGLMTTAFPKVHVVIAGIEKVIPSINDLPKILPVLSTTGTGQQVTAYNSIIFGAKNDLEVDGPEKMYVILLDNGRTNLLKVEPQFEALTCIRCGACLNFCPVFSHIGGFTYQSVYGGPIGSIISQHLFPESNYEHLSFACTLCGKCTDVCPAKINIHNNLLHNRALSSSKNKAYQPEFLSFKGLSLLLSKRDLLNFFTNNIFRKFDRFFLTQLWGKRRLMVNLKKSFSVTYKKSVDK